MIHVLPDQPKYFPHPYHVDEQGVLAVGGNLNPETLIMAYSSGIFPWTNEDEPLVWWYTFPRMILYPSDIKVSKSMRQVLRQANFNVSFNQNFSAVLDHCQNIKRKGQQGTWLFDELKQSMLQLHQMGIAHSVEVWQDNKIVGGLYGLGIGRIFCGESMFAHVSNASKVALIYLARLLESLDFDLIDCQQETAHLKSMGAVTMGGGEFLDHLRANALQPLDYLSQCLSKEE